MSKKKHPIRKLFAFTTTIAAVGGTCYVFRDKIKKNSAFRSASDKLSDLITKKGKCNEDSPTDGVDDEFNDVFSDSNNEKREYTSITINSKKEVPIPTIDITPDKGAQSKAEKEEESATNKTTEDEKSSSKESSKKEDSTDPETYENEGLTDLSEDADALEEQDKLDF